MILNISMLAHRTCSPVDAPNPSYTVSSPKKKIGSVSADCDAHQPCKRFIRIVLSEGGLYAPRIIFEVYGMM